MSLASEETLAAATEIVRSPEVKTISTGAATQLTTTATKAKRGVVLTPDPGNTYPIYFGTANSVTATLGWFIVVNPYDPPILIPLADASSLWAFSAGAGQKVGFGVL